MKTAEQYYKDLKKMKPNLYIGGEKVGRDDPRIKPGINVVSVTYDLAQDPEWDGLLTAISSLTGEKINRFTHLPQNPYDLIQKQKMVRLLCHRVGGCIQRCMGNDMMNALSIVTKEADEKSGGKTEYYDRFLAFLREFQEKDMVGAGAQTDVKGNRMLRPSQQEDPDLYLRVVERNAKGVVVRGCKVHTSVGPYCDELIVTPCRSLTEKEGDWAVCFAVPADTPGVHMLIEAANPTPR